MCVQTPVRDNSIRRRDLGVRLSDVSGERGEAHTAIGHHRHECHPVAGQGTAPGQGPGNTNHIHFILFIYVITVILRHFSPVS